ncbi:hypothetical protein PINS_up024162 [Pythium insidiosum]|nr:hypothetical protein PINS_up024162 [Pythium insidiosum]
MFKKFNVDEHVSGHSMVKSSQQRQIRAKILEQYPDVEPYMELLLPKKAPWSSPNVWTTCRSCCMRAEPLSSASATVRSWPTLRVLHKVPHIMKWVRADKGAIRSCSRAPTSCAPA